MLVRLLYASHAAQSLSTEMIDSILDACRTNNPSHGITGILCYSGDTFIQVLEGGRLEVSRMYNTIVRDQRHREVMLLNYEEISERRFCDWSMGHVNLAKINPSIMLKYCEMPELNPFNISGHAAMDLMEELIASACIVGRSS